MGGGGGGGGGGGLRAHNCTLLKVAHSVDQSVQSAEIFFAFIFQLSGWALVAPLCFALQVRDASIAVS